ncbi:hypothetical protein ACWD7F_13270 [Streptomyces sp. NPDC005122]
MVSGLASSLPSALSGGLQAHGVPAGAAEHAASLPPVSTLFATFLGNNPIEHLLASGGALAHLSPAQHAALTGHTFFPRLVSAPFHHGLAIVFGVAAGIALVSALASALRGGRGPAEDTPPRDRGPAAAVPSPTGRRRHHTPS